MELNPYATYLSGQDPIPVLTSTAERLQSLTATLTGAKCGKPIGGENVAGDGRKEQTADILE